jgi:polyphenol oxidase
MTPPTTFAVEARALHGVPVVTWPAFAGHPLDAIVTTRDRAVSAGSGADLNLSLSTGDDAAQVLANRELVARALDTTLDDFVFGAQVHRPSVQVVTEEHRGRGARTAADAIPSTDALVTTVPGIVLGVLVADCVPLVLFDPVRRVLACVHAGWRGTVSGVTAAAVATMQELGSDPADLLVGIGPSIAPDRYQVGADVVDAATAAFPDQVDQVVRPDGAGAWTFDLWRANTLQLLAAGVRESRVNLAGLDTGPGTPYFSHRSEAPCGRFGAFARLTEEPR